MDYDFVITIPSLSLHLVDRIWTMIIKGVLSLLLVYYILIFVRTHTCRYAFILHCYSFVAIICEMSLMSSLLCRSITICKCTVVDICQPVLSYYRTIN